MESYREMEKCSHTSPLGLRFRDAVSGEFVSAGLNVTAYSAANPTKRRLLYPSRSGTFVLQNVPELRDFEYRRPPKVWEAPLPDNKLIIEVVDLERRFIPFQLTVMLPVKGIYTWVSPLDSSPGKQQSSVPLYSSVTRQSLTGMAVIRAEMFDLSSRRPAPWVLLEALYNGQLIARGIADEKGRITLYFEYPAPRYTWLSSPPDSPLVGGGRPMFSQSWDLQLNAYYSPASPPKPDEDLPDLQSVFSQSKARLWEDAAMTRPLTQVSLQYGRELILRSNEVSPLLPASSNALPSVLFINPA